MKIRSFTVGVVSTQCYLACDSRAGIAFIVDPGDNAQELLQAVEAENARLEYVILTHAHFDHVMAAAQIIEKTGAKLVVCGAEVDALTDPVLSGYTSFGIPMQDKLRADIILNDGDSLDFGQTKLKIMHTPGHTKGSMCIVADNIIFTGDTLFAGTCGRCDLPGGDYKEMLDSLKRLGELDGDYTLYPGHGEPTMLDIERKFNPYMREAIRR